MLFGTPFGTKFNEFATSIHYGSYSLDSIIARLPKVHYSEDCLLCAIAHHTYKMSARVGIPTPSYQMDVIIILSPQDPRLSDAYINVLMWAYGNEYRRAARSIDLMALRMKLDFANTNDLDDYWSPLLGLRRRTLEDDDSYRARLATHIRIITSSGTKNNCQAVIDRITGLPGGSRIESFAAEVVLSWTSPDVIEVAKEKSALISEAMDRMLAAGISWSTSYPIATYQMDFKEMYPEFVTYQMNGSVRKKRGVVYHMASSLWDVGSADYQMDAILYSKVLQSYRAGARLVQDKSIDYQMGGVLLELRAYSRYSSYRADAAIQDKKRRFYTMSGDIT